MNAIAMKAGAVAKKLYFKLAQKAPVLYLAGGIVCIVGGTVYAIAKSDSAHNIMDTFQNEMDEIHKNEEIADKRQNPEQWYPQADRKKHKKACYGHMIKSMAKLYLPVLLLEMVGVLAICHSHKLITKQAAALSASLATVTNQFNTYRKRVEDKYGKEAEEAIFYGFEDHEVTEVIQNPDGTETSVTKQVKTADPVSRWARFIDECCGLWEKNPHYTIDNVRVRLSTLDRMLKTYGFLTMNDIYKQLDLPLDAVDGNIWGIVYDPLNENKFMAYFDKLYSVSTQATRRFINGYEDVLLIDIQPEGQLSELLQKGKKYGLERMAPARL